MDSGKGSVEIVIAGTITPQIMKSYTCARELKEKHPDRVTDFTVTHLFPAQWDLHLKELQNLKKGDFYGHKGHSLVVYLVHPSGETTYIGGCESFLEWALQGFRYVDNTSNIIYKNLSANAYKAAVNDTEGRSYVRLEIAQGGGRPERVLVELFDDVCPKTCANFKTLCTGFKRAADHKLISYLNTDFDRVVKGKFIQGGDIRKLFGLPGAFSAFEEGEFADESFAKKHDEPGLIGMCQRSGYANTNECQFYITLSAPLKFMDNKNVVFGRIVDGMRTMRMIEQQDTYNEVPVKKITIEAATLYKA